MGKIQLIDAETLYYKPLEHPKMLIDGVLSDGLAIMAGDSKIGKSWMVLWMCLQISKGEPVWGAPHKKDGCRLSRVGRSRMARPTAYAGPDGYAAGQSAFRLFMRSARC